MKALSVLSIKQKLIMVIMSTTLSGIMAIGVAVTFYEWEESRRDMAQTVLTLAEVIGTNSTAALTFKDPRTAEETISVLRAEPHVVLGCIYSKDLSLFAAYWRKGSEKYCPHYLTENDGARFYPGALRLSSGIFLDQERIGSIFIQSDLRGLNQRITLFIGALSILILVVSLLSYLLSLRFQSLISKPILGLSRIAKQISEEKDYSVRAPKHSVDEVGSLVESFNEMLGYIQERDLSIQRSNEELKASKDKAEASSRIKSEFLDIAAHELRTPLTALTLLIEAFQRQFKQGKPISAGALQRIVHQTDRLVGLVDDLLNVSRLERGGFALHPVLMDLNSIVSECIEDFKARAPNRTFILEKPQEPVTLEADPVRILQVLANLLDNALKYTPETTAIEVKISPAPGKRVRVSVTDHGKGIPKEQQAYLFTQFYRLGSDETIQQPGLGLGLYISRRIVELHAGRIAVDSEPGKGSSFYFEIPRKAP